MSGDSEARLYVGKGVRPTSGFSTSYKNKAILKS